MVTADRYDCYTSRATTMPRRKALKIDVFARRRARRKMGRHSVAPVHVKYADHAEPLTYNP